MTAYGTMQESAAFRNTCRALNVDYDKTNEVAKDIDSYRNHADWKDIIEISAKFIGVIDSVSPHPCASLLLSTPISEDVGVIKVGDEYVALIDSTTSDNWKYLKNDYLTVTVWGIIADVFDYIGKPIPDVRTITKLVEGNEKVWDLYAKGHTATLNQAGTDSGTPQVVQYKPQSIRELSGWVSAIRPSFASMKAYFLNRRDFSYGIPAFDQLLETSDNFILYQEDIMKTLVYVGFPEDETYGLLKAIAKKKEGIIEPIHERFVNGFIEKTGSKDDALKVWRIIEDAVGYGFNSSHAYAVALDSIYGAYLKAEYPLEYYTIVLNIYEDDVKMQNKIMKELKDLKINVMPIEFGKSKSKYSHESSTNSIYKGIKSIKYMNSMVAESLHELSEKNEYDKDDFVSLARDIIEQTSVDTRQMEILIRLDFFKYFGSKEILLEIYLTMNDKKKPDIERYPDFADKVVIEEKLNKKTGETTKKEKVVKKPVKYTAGLSEKGKAERLNNLKEYEKAVRANPPAKIGLYEQVSFEKERLGYAVSVYPDMPDNVMLITEVNKKFTPRLTVYQVNNGEELSYKVKKNKFWINDEDMLVVGDVVQILETKKEFGWKNSNGKWERDESKIESFIEKVKILRRSSKRNFDK